MYLTITPKFQALPSAKQNSQTNSTVSLPKYSHTLVNDTVSFGNISRAVNTVADHLQAQVAADSGRLSRIATTYLDVLESVAFRLKDKGFLFDRAYAELHPVKSPEAYTSKIMRSGHFKVSDTIRSTLYCNNSYDLSLLNDSLLPEMEKRGFILSTTEKSIKDLIKRGYLPNSLEASDLNKKITVPDLDIRLDNVSEQVTKLSPDLRYSISKPQKSGYEDMLNQEDSKESEMRFENLMEFIGVAMEFENETADATLADFLDSIALVSDVDKLDESSEAVTLMTMHSAKGLEFDDVFLVGMEDGLFPSKRSIDEVDGIEEERRLCYVGITRAKERLYITNASKRTLYGSTTYTMPSRFIDEISDDLLDEQSQENKSLRKRKSEDYLDNEYSQVDSIISSNNFIPKSTSNKSSFGLSVDSFLKNISGVSSKPSYESKSFNNDYTVGMQVKHKKFGVGVIKKIEEEGEDFKLDIQFENFGFKRLMANFTPLEIIEK